MCYIFFFSVSSVKKKVSCLACFVLLNQSSLQTLFLYNIHFITFYRINLVSISCLLSSFFVFHLSIISAVSDFTVPFIQKLSIQLFSGFKY